MNSILTKSRILVTGGAGFIGSNLVEALLAAGNEVTVLDNFSTGKRENLAAFAGNRGFRLLEGDIRELPACREAVTGMEFVLHQAALGSVPRSIADPMTSTAVNILGFVNMLHASKEAGVKRFVYASSSSVYGSDTTTPKREERIGRALSPYAITKFVDELFAENFHDLYGIDTVGFRYFNVFGRRQDPFGVYAAVIPRFAAALIRHERPVINGDGSTSRDFTYIDNVVRANLLALTATAPEALNRCYNVACGKSSSLNELFGWLRGNLARFDGEIAKIEPVYGPERTGDIRNSLASVESARGLLGYVPAVGVERGLELAAEWYFRNLK